MGKRLGLVMTGGGARAAYQVGVVRGIYEITQVKEKLFEVITGNSAGAINATYLAANSENWNQATAEMVRVWQDLKPQMIFDLRTKTISQLGLKWVSATAFGGLSNDGSQINYLLDTSPLQRVLKKEIEFEKIKQNINSKNVHGIALSTTNYNSGSSVIFYQGDYAISDWARSDRFSRREDIRLDHVMASTAIPFFFPPIKVNDSFFGDGCIRQTTPLSPAIHLGADKIIGIGIRYPHPQHKMMDMALSPMENPSVGQIAGVMLNSIFLDSLEADVERMNHINTLIKDNESKKFKAIPILMIRPSRDLGKMTEKLNEDLPIILRYLLKGIGVSNHKGLDLLSYLAFDESYTKPLIELGYEDTIRMKDEILRFIDA